MRNFTVKQDMYMINTPRYQTSSDFMDSEAKKDLMKMAKVGNTSTYFDSTLSKESRPILF